MRAGADGSGEADRCEDAPVGADPVLAHRVERGELLVGRGQVQMNLRNRPLPKRGLAPAGSQHLGGLAAENFATMHGSVPVVRIGCSNAGQLRMRVVNDVLIAVLRKPRAARSGG